MDLFKELLPSITLKTLRPFDVDFEAASNGYNAFMVNRALSQYPDCIHQAQQMNMMSHLSPYEQWCFLNSTINKKKRYSQWAKKAPTSNILSAIIEVYKVNSNVASEYLSLMTREQQQELLDYVDKGGTGKYPK
jgi:hypothetical protein